MIVSKKQLLGRLLVLLILLGTAGAVVWAMKKQWFHEKLMAGNAKEVWTTIDADPWQEMSQLMLHAHQSMPYMQAGKALLKDTNDSLLEEKDFRMTYFDSATMTYQVAHIEMVQTPQWQAVIDHDQQLVSFTALKQGVSPQTMQFDLLKLKKLFSDGHFTLRVMQNEKGDRMLVSEDFTNGTTTGLQVKYNTNAMNVTDVNMGLPKLVTAIKAVPKDGMQTDTTGLQLLTESMQLKYAPLQAIATDESIKDPRQYFTIRNKKLVVLDKRFEHYQFLSNIK